MTVLIAVLQVNYSAIALQACEYSYEVTALIAILQGNQSVIFTIILVSLD